MKTLTYFFALALLGISSIAMAERFVVKIYNYGQQTVLFTVVPLKHTHSDVSNGTLVASAEKTIVLKKANKAYNRDFKHYINKHTVRANINVFNPNFPNPPFCTIQIVSGVNIF